MLPLLLRARKGTNDAHTQWAARKREWMEMVLHRSHDAGGFDVTHNTISRRAAFHTFTSPRFWSFNFFKIGPLWERSGTGTALLASALLLPSALLLASALLHLRRNASFPNSPPLPLRRPLRGLSWQVPNSGSGHSGGGKRSCNRRCARFVQAHQPCPARRSCRWSPAYLVPHSSRGLLPCLVAQGCHASPAHLARHWRQAAPKAPAPGFQPAPGCPGCPGALRHHTPLALRRHPPSHRVQKTPPVREDPHSPHNLPWAKHERATVSDKATPWHIQYAGATKRLPVPSRPSPLAQPFKIERG
jgi:hypothetical protein